MDNNWRRQAACKNEDTEIFYAESTKAARKVCAICTVQEECLEFALTTKEQDGFWGGFTEEERRTILKARRRRSA